MKKSTLIFFVFLIIVLPNPARSQEADGISVSVWIERLQSKDKSSRMSEDYALLNLGEDQRTSILTLIQALKHEDANVRRYVTNALGEIQSFPELVVPALMEALRDQNKQVREHAVIALAKLGSAAVPTLVEALKQTDVSIAPSEKIGFKSQTDVRLSDLVTIALWKTEAPVVAELFNFFRREIKDRRGLPDKQVDEHSVGYLKKNIALIIRNHNRTDVGELIPFLKDADPEVRSLALNSLEKISPGDSDAISTVTDIVSSKITPLAQEAIPILIRSGGDEVPAAVDIFQSQADPEVRALVISYLTQGNEVNSNRRMNLLLPLYVQDYLKRMGRNDIPRLAIALQSDTDPRVRELAAHALANLADVDEETVIVALAKALKDQSPFVQRIASGVLSEIIGRSGRLSPAVKTIIPDLCAALQTTNNRMEIDIARALGSIGPDAKAAVPFLIESLRTLSESNLRAPTNLYGSQIAIIRALGEIAIGDPDAAFALRRILNDGSRQHLHVSAILALGKIEKSYQAAVSILVDKFKSADNSDDWEVIADALASAPPAGITALLQIFQDQNQEVEARLIACKTFEQILKQSQNNKILENEILNALRNALKDPRRRIHTCAAAQLADYGEATKVVLSLLEDDFIEDPFGESAYHLERLGSKSLPTLIRLLRNPNPEARQRAASILWKIAGETRLSPADARSAVKALIALLQKEIRPERQTPYDRYSGPAGAALAALHHFGPYVKDAMPAIISWTAHPDKFVRLNAVEILGCIGPSAGDARTALIEALKDTDPSVQTAAARSLLNAGFTLGKLDPIFTTVVIDNYIDRLFKDAYDLIAETLRSSITETEIRSLRLSAVRRAGANDLPGFPWPNPPTPAHIAIFGREVPRELLGTDSKNLGAVYQRIFQSLIRTDPKFESGLFGVPGGFALLAKTERIKEDGTPLPGDYRWMQGHIPPLNLEDYIGQLFFDKPGYFRILAFVVTTKDYSPQEQNLRRLPDISEGATDLPREIAEDTFHGKKAYLLVYSFKRARGGRVTDFKINTSSALTHLEKSGIMHALKTAY